MNTFVKDGIVSLNQRLQEVDLILDHAKLHIDSNEHLYKALCRSAQVLLSAHFEGYLKDLVKNAIEDINQYSTFKKCNFDLKKKLCEYFIDPPRDEKHSKSNYNKVKELIEVFDSLNTKFKREYFYADNKNPKATVLDNIAKQFGVDHFFKQLKKTKLDLVFSNTNPENVILCTQIKEYILASTETFPYAILLDFLEINPDKPAADNLWDPFLSELLKRRHDIAHGTETENTVGHSIIESDKVKIEILSYAFTAFICIQCNPVREELEE